MSRKIQICIVTPFFLLMVTFSCLLFTKLDKEHRTKLAFDTRSEELMALKGLEEDTKDALRYVVDSLASSSNFRLNWSRKFLGDLQVISEDSVSVFDLIVFILHDEKIEGNLLLVKNEKTKYNRLLRILSDSLQREYESEYFFDRARRFAQCIGMEEETVLKVLKEGIEAVKCDGDLASIEAVLDFFTSGKESSSRYSYSLL